MVYNYVRIIELASNVWDCPFIDRRFVEFRRRAGLSPDVVADLRPPWAMGARVLCDISPETYRHL